MSCRILLPDHGLFFLRAQQSKKEADSGEYWCRASNSAGNVTSKRGHLQVACKYYLTSNVCQNINCLTLILLDYLHGLSYAK